MSAATGAWVDAQNAVTFAYLDTLPQLCEKFGKGLDYERESAPVDEGKYTYFRRNSGLQNQAVIYRLNAAGEESVFIDPNTCQGTVRPLLLPCRSKSGNLAAYQKSEGGGLTVSRLLIPNPSK